jgi:hypothetical protein
MPGAEERNSEVEERNFEAEAWKEQKRKKRKEQQLTPFLTHT